MRPVVRTPSVDDLLASDPLAQIDEDRIYLTYCLPYCLRGSTFLACFLYPFEVINLSFIWGRCHQTDCLLADLSYLQFTVGVGLRGPSFHTTTLYILNSLQSIMAWLPRIQFLFLFGHTIFILASLHR